MNNAIYAAVLGTRIESFRLDVVANNIANAGTPGYKSETPSFLSHLDYLSRPEYDASRKALKDVSKYFSTTSRFTAGPVRYTGRETDLAIEGEGFFVLETPRGEAYTRAGNFHVDAEGNLVNSAGYPILGEGGPITVDPSEVFIVTEEGAVFSGSDQVDVLRVVDFNNAGGLKKLAGNVFINPGSAAQKPEPRFSIVQNALEGSNVNVMRQMTAMVSAGRRFEAYTRVIRLVDDINSRATQSLGNA